MGIYYSSVGTRLNNCLRAEELTIEDFAVISPKLVMRIKNLGRKSEVAIIDRLEELNMKPGRWLGEELTWYKALPYYKEHREEIRKKYPIQYIEKPEEQKPEPEKPKDDWEEYRKQLAKEIFLIYIKSEADSPINSPQVLSEAAADAADALIEELKKDYQ